MRIRISYLNLWGLAGAAAFIPSFLFHPNEKLIGTFGEWAYFIFLILSPAVFYLDYISKDR